MSLSVPESTDTIIEINPNNYGVFTLLDGMYIELGDLEDWAELHALHYKDSGSPTGSTTWRVKTRDGRLVGVVLMTTCTLLLAARHRVFHKIKPGNDTYYTNATRANWLNRNMRRASRVVTDTVYRGGGVGYRMLNLAARISGFRFIEIQSSMSKYNPFDQKAGFKHAHLNNQRFYDQGFTFFRGLFEAHPADHEAIMEEYREMSPFLQKAVCQTMREQYYKWSPREKTGGSLNTGTARIDQMSFSQIVREMQQLLFATPAYGVYENPDFGRKDMPNKLPLCAFDWQKTNEPLDLSRLT